MNNFCTLFNSGYLTRGLQLHNSILEHCEQFHLFIFAFDDITFNVLSEIDLKHCTIISLKDFLTDDTIRIKKERTFAEFCWTSTPFIVDYVFRNYNQIDSCTYLDADIYFYSNPQVLLNEIPSDKSVLITEHNFADRYKHLEKFGRFCVQFMYFKNESQGREVLERWRKDCSNWCYNKYEDGKFGDQKYWDNYVQEYDSIFISENIGAGVAPWNIDRFEINNANNLKVKDIINGKERSVVFYHFHDLRFYKIGNKPMLLLAGEYAIDSHFLRYIYYPYLTGLELQKILIKQKFSSFENNVHGETEYNPEQHNSLTIIQAVRILFNTITQSIKYHLWQN